MFGDMALIGQMYDPDVAFLPIGGHFTMGPDGAAIAARMIGAPAVVPIHFGTFPILAGTPAQLASELEDADIEIIEASIGAPIS